MKQDINIYCVACETLLTQVSRKDIEPGRVEFDLACGGCGRQHKLTRIFKGTEVTDVFLLTRKGREDRIRE